MNAEQINSSETTKDQIQTLLTEIRQETFRAGYREGRIEARISIVRRMRKAGIEWKMIEQITGLNREDYRDLQGYWPGKIS